MYDFSNRSLVMLTVPGEPIQDVRELFRRLYAQLDEFQATSRLTGQLLDTRTADPAGNIEIGAFQIEGDQYSFATSVFTDASGNFSLDYLEPGKYLLALANGEFDLDRDRLPDLTPATYIVTAQTDISGEVLYADVGPGESTHENESNASFVAGPDGTPHMVWVRDDQIWHAYHNGEAWVGAAAIEGCRERIRKSLRAIASWEVALPASCAFGRMATATAQTCSIQWAAAQAQLAINGPLPLT